MRLLQIKISLIAFLGLLLFVGCQTTLAPAYDRAIFEGAARNGELAMRFFAEVSEGTETENFFRRQPVYDQLIGAFETLQIQAKARPLPENAAVEKINSLLRDRGTQTLSGKYPSAVAFGEIADIFRKMKEVDDERGLKPLAIQAFKEQVIIFLDQALTYESFLKR